MCNHPTTTPFSYDDIDRVIDAVDDISFSVNDEISLGDPMKALYISTAIIEEMSTFSCQIEHSGIDDSIELAFNTLERLTHAELTDEQHNKLLDALLSLSYHPALQDEWGRLRAIELAIGIIRNEQERTRVVFALDKMQQRPSLPCPIRRPCVCNSSSRRSSQSCPSRLGIYEKKPRLGRDVWRGFFISFCC